MRCPRIGCPSRKFVPSAILDSCQGRQQSGGSANVVAVENPEHHLTTVNFRTRKYGKQESRQGVYFVARTGLLDLEVGFNVSKGRSEHKGYHWLPYQQARGMVKKRLQSVLDWAYEIISKGHPVTGPGQ